MKRVTENLKLVRKAFDSVGWTTGVDARDILGNATSYEDEKAVCFCVTGLVFKLIKDWEDRFEVFDELRKNTNLSRFEPVYYFNDKHCKDKQDVEEWLDRAIKNSE